MRRASNVLRMLRGTSAAVGKGLQLSSRAGSTAQDGSWCSSGAGWRGYQAFWMWASPLVASMVMTCQLTQAHASNDAIEPEALQELARDLAQGTAADKERAVSMLSSLTLYVDHHGALLNTPGVLECLLDAVIDERLVPQVRNIALTCTADLMKDPQAHVTALKSDKFLAGLLAALKAEGSWKDGLDDGQVAQAQAARCCAELAGRPDTHSALVANGLAAQIAVQAGRLVHEFGSVGSEYASISEVPGSMDAMSVVEEERFIAAAAFGLAGSTVGASVLARNPQAMKGIVHWAGNSKDPVLLRWGVGALGRSIVAGGESQSTVVAAGGLAALLSALNCSDPQAQCFASAAVGALARDGNQSATSLADLGVAAALMKMVEANAAVPSEGVKQGIRVCALKAITTCVSNPQLSRAMQQAGMADHVQGLQERGAFASEELKRMATYVVRELA